MSFDKFAKLCWDLYDNKPLLIHIFLISLLFCLFLGVLTEITGGVLGSIFSLISFIPFLILFLYFALFILFLHFINRTRTIISMIFIVLISFALLDKEVDNILFSILQDLLYIPILFGIFYVWMAIASIDDDKKESFPTFKRWGRNLNPFKHKNTKLPKKLHQKLKNK